MTVFKTFWKVVKKYKGTIILYTTLLIIFGGLNMSANNQSTQFVDSKPDILIINHDQNHKLSNHLVKYIKKHSNLVKIKQNEEAISDALFYRDVNFIIDIPKNYSQDIMNGENPTIHIQSTGDYQASLAQMLLMRYIRVQNIYKTKTHDEEELIQKINHSMDKKATVELTSKLDISKTSNVSTYFSFASYSIMAVVIFVICLVMSSFKERKLHKRTIISSMNYKTYNRQLLLASFLYTCIVWLLFILLGMFLFQDVLFTTRGILYMLNSFVFSFCCLTIALFISTVVSNKNAVNGIVNVIALGSAFLCGAFVPAEWLPNSVLNIAHILPAYWYIHSNDLLKKVEILDFNNLKPIFINCLVMIGFSIIFIIINNIISKHKQKFN